MALHRSRRFRRIFTEPAMIPSAPAAVTSAKQRGPPNPVTELKVLIAPFPSVKTLQGDLFACPASDSLAHCVSEGNLYYGFVGYDERNLDLRMGKGIAVLFKNKFWGLSELEAQHRRVRSPPA